MSNVLKAFSLLCRKYPSKTNPWFINSIFRFVLNKFVIMLRVNLTLSWLLPGGKFSEKLFYSKKTQKSTYSTATTKYFQVLTLLKNIQVQGQLNYTINWFSVTVCTFPGNSTLLRQLYQPGNVLTSVGACGDEHTNHQPHLLPPECVQNTDSTAQTALDFLQLC